MIKKKIAFCLHGGRSQKKSDYNGNYTGNFLNHNYIEYDDNINNFVDFKACYKSIKKHIIDCNPSYNVDIYIHMWYQNKQMTKTGFESIAIAKQNGYWSFMDDAENLIIPNDLKKALAAHQNSFKNFLSLSKSKQKELLGWIVLAKLPETKQKRIRKIIEYVNQGI